jgi:putative copper export protein
LLVFAVCLCIGGFEADNTFGTAVGRALVAMGGTFVIGLVLGAMARKMLDENLAMEKEKLKNNEANSLAEDR